MPALRCLIFAAALLITFSGAAFATCQDLALAVDLTERNFAPGATSRSAELTQLNDAISRISNDELLRVLRSEGRANAFGDLRNFLTQLKFISASADGNDFRFTPKMQANLGFVRELVDTVCADGGPQPDPALAGKKATERAGENPLSSISQWPGAKNLFGGKTGATYQDDGQLHMLVELVLLVFMATVLVITGRYALQLFRLNQRRRRICVIPAELICMMTTLPGHLTVLELTCCIFTPAPCKEADDMRDVSAGTYCTLRVDEVDLSARLTTPIKDEVEILFDAPISARTQACFLAQSEAPVRLDLSPLKERSVSVTAS